MIECVRPFLISLGKAKAAKLVRNLVDLFLDIEISSTAPEKERKGFQEIKVRIDFEGQVVVGVAEEISQGVREKHGFGFMIL